MHAFFTKVEVTEKMLKIPKLSQKEVGKLILQQNYKIGQSVKVFRAP